MKFFILPAAASIVIAFITGFLLNRGKISMIFEKLAAVFLIAHALFRAVLAGWWPMVTLYEILCWFALSTVLFVIIFERLYPHRYVKALKLTIIVAGAALIYALTTDASLKPPAPALRSGWFFWHITVAVMAYPLFLYSSFHILGERDFSSRALRYVLSLAIVFYTFGIISGAAWAEEAWGTYWQWDPKETWALLTWFVYSALYHSLLLKRKWPSAVLAVMGLVFVGVTFVGINFIVKLLGIPSLHAYTS